MTTTYDFDYFAARLGVASWKVKTPGRRDAMMACPVHGGSDSLSVTEKGGKVLLHCFNGSCDASEGGRAYQLVTDAIESPGPKITIKRSVDAEAGDPAKTVISREVFVIRDTRGKVHARHTRIDYGDGSKDFLWAKGTEPKALPLYGSEAIASYDTAEPLIVTEGERKRDILAAAGYQAVGLAGGSSVKPAVSALAALAGFELILWPDNDDPGREVMDFVARATREFVSGVRVVQPWKGAKPKDDAADFLASHSLDEADALLRSAPSWVAQEPEGWGDGTGKDVLDLLTSKYPELRFVVPGLLPEGSAILASNPKIGKSAMLYQLGAALSTGGDFLGSAIEQRPVLYYALEDGERRSQGRAAASLAGTRPKRGMLEFRWAAPKIGEGLEDEVEAWLEGHERGVVFIDTFEKVRSTRRSNANAYKVDVAEFTVLQDIIRRLAGSTIVLILHLRKAADSDFLARVSGSLGLTGSADTTLVLERERIGGTATMSVTGRDVGEAQAALRFDGLRWSRDDDRIPGASPERQYVYEVLAEMAPAWPKAVAEEIVSRGGDATRESIKKVITGLIDIGWVVWSAGGYKPKGPIVTVSAAAQSAGTSGTSKQPKAGRRGTRGTAGTAGTVGTTTSKEKR